MCRFKSCLILKDRVYVPNHDSHEIMLEELNIKDTFENAASIFVRAEIYPEDGDVFSDVTGWKMRVDQDILPDWYVHEIDESRAKSAVEEWMKNHTISEGEKEVRDGIWIVHGSAKVKAFGNATITAYESATVTVNDSATVKAHISATVKAFGSAEVKAYDRADVTAYDSAKVKAYDSATVKAQENTKVEAYNRATVIIPNYYGPKMDNIDVYNDAIAIDHNTNTIKANKKWEMKE